MATRNGETAEVEVAKKELDVAKAELRVAKVQKDIYSMGNF